MPESPIPSYRGYTPPTADGPIAHRLAIENAEAERLLVELAAREGRPASEAEQEWIAGHMVNTHWVYLGHEAPSAAVAAVLDEWIAQPIPTHLGHPHPERWDEYRNEMRAHSLKDERQQKVRRAGLKELLSNHPELSAAEKEWLTQVVTALSWEEPPTNPAWRALSELVTGLPHRDPDPDADDPWAMVRQGHEMIEFRWMREPEPHHPHIVYGIEIPDGSCEHDPIALKHRERCAIVERVELLRVVFDFVRHAHRTPTPKEREFLHDQVVCATTMVLPGHQAVSEEASAAIDRWMAKPLRSIGHPAPSAWDSERNGRYRYLRESRAKLTAAAELIAKLETQTGVPADDTDRKWLTRVVEADPHAGITASQAAWEIADAWVQAGPGESEHPDPAHWRWLVRSYHGGRTKERLQSEMAERALSSVATAVPDLTADERQWVFAQAGGARYGPDITPRDEITAAFQAWAVAPDPGDASHPELQSFRTNQLEELTRELLQAAQVDQINCDLQAHEGRTMQPEELSWARYVVAGSYYYRPPSPAVVESTVRWLHRVEPPVAALDPERWEYQRFRALEEFRSNGIIPGNDVAQPEVEGLGG